MNKAIRRTAEYALLIAIIVAAIGATSLFLSFNKRLVGESQIEALAVEWDQVLTGSIRK